MGNEEGKAYIMTEEELHAVQRIEVEMLEEVDRICKKCGIHYSIIGGTLLGAVRHKGYIPWDDDADVALLRSEYEKFVEACKTELDHDRFYFQDMKNTKGYRWGYGKLRRKGTEFVRLGQEFMPYEQGIFIDLFPLDNVPDHPAFRWVHLGLCFLLRKFLWSKVGCRTEKNPFLRTVYRIMNLVPEKLLVCWYDCMGAATSHRKTKQVRTLTFPTPPKKFGYDRKWYTCQRRFRFENTVLTGMKDYDGYLTHKFGNYMELPPESERKIHPVSRLKLLT